MKEEISDLTIRAADLFKQHQMRLHDDNAGQDHGRIIRDPIQVMGKRWMHQIRVWQKEGSVRRSRSQRPRRIHNRPMTIPKFQPQITEESMANMNAPSPCEQIASYA